MTSDVPRKLFTRNMIFFYFWTSVIAKLTIIISVIGYFIWFVFISYISYSLSVYVDYLISWNFRDTLISRFRGSHISRHLNFAILRKFCIWLALILRFWVRHTLLLCQCYLASPWIWSNLINNVRINRNATDYVNSNKKGYLVFEFQCQCLRRIM